jgi:CelD/BcsL family acetyltransferase involved in cellulose biosynthesis
MPCLDRGIPSSPEVARLAGLVVNRLNSLDALRRAAPAWDELWWRSESALPTSRAELLVLWCECFAQRQSFTALTVQRDGQLVGALPLVAGRRRGIMLGQLPTNAWSPAGDLLLDSGENQPEICDTLVHAVRQCGLPLLWLDAVPAGARRWQAFLAACRNHDRAVVQSRRFVVDVVRIENSSDEYFAARAASHRKHMRQAAGRAARVGSFALACYDDLSPARVEPLLRSCFAVEASGWKGRAHSAVLNVPGIWDFYLRQARQLAAWGQLSINCWEHDTVPAAFEYGWRAKGVYCSPKVGYDEAFSLLSPGQSLRNALLKQLYVDGQTEWLDFLGPSSRATRAWATDAYGVDRLVVSLDGLWSRALVTAYSNYRTLRRLGQRDAPIAGALDEPSGPPPGDLSHSASHGASRGDFAKAPAVATSCERAID